MIPTLATDEKKTLILGGGGAGKAESIFGRRSLFSKLTLIIIITT
jgi:hypothetical protein